MTRLRPHAIPLGIAALFLAGALFEESWQYSREALLNGEVWRLFTCHFTHLGLYHAALNAAGLLLYHLLYGHRLSAATNLLLLTAPALGTASGMLLFSPEIAWYVGFSGVLHGLLIGAAALDVVLGRREGWLVLLIIGGKVLQEQAMGGSELWSSLIGGPVLVEAHIYGALSGLLAAAVVTAFPLRKTASRGYRR